MSDFRRDNPAYVLDGREPLNASYDKEADVLYLWRGDAPREAISLTTDNGVVVRFDPETSEIVGFTLIDWSTLWAGKDSIEIELPAIGQSEREEEPGRTHRVAATAAG